MTDFTEALERARKSLSLGQGGREYVLAKDYLTLWEEHQAALADRERFQKTLGMIAQLSDKTLLGPEEDIERFHERGAHKAFNQAAEIAVEALVPFTGEKQ